MKYQEFKPSAKLEKFVDAYWAFTGVGKGQVERILPDGSSDIIFNLGPANSSIPQETIAISGMMTKYTDVTFEGPSDLFGIRFQPGKLGWLTRHPLFEVKNLTVEAHGLIPAFNSGTIAQLWEKKSLLERLQFLEGQICNILREEKTAPDPLITSVTDFLLHTAVPVQMKALADEHCISLRQLERRFKHRVGVTMKEFARIARFKRTRKQIAERAGESLLHIAFDNGYYDHAHLANEFKQFTGKAPSLTKGKS